MVNHHPRPREFGGAAIEYILVSTFATLLSLASITFVGSYVKEKIQIIAEETGIEIDLDFIEIFRADK